MEGTDGLHVFFDSTEVAGPPDLPLGRIALPNLGYLARATGTKLYVADLVVEEVVNRRARILQDRHRKLTSTARSVERYVAVGAIAAIDADELLARLRVETEEALSKIPVAVVPCDTVPLEEVLNLSLRRTPPFRGDEDPKGFQDAVVLLASLEFARANGIRECVFVSEDGDHTDAAIRQLAQERGLVCQLVNGTQALLEQLEAADKAQVDAFFDFRVAAATDFVRHHSDEIERFLDKQPLRLADLSGSVTGRILEVSAVEVEVNEAYPTGARHEGADAEITFFAKANVSLIVEMYVPGPSSEATVEVRPGVRFPEGVSPTPNWEWKPIPHHVSIPLRGTGRALWRDGQHHPPFRVEGLTVVRPTGLSAALMGLGALNPFAQ